MEKGLARLNSPKFTSVHPLLKFLILGMLASAQLYFACSDPSRGLPLGQRILALIQILAVIASPLCIVAHSVIYHLWQRQLHLNCIVVSKALSWIAWSPFLLFAIGVFGLAAAIVINENVAGSERLLFFVLQLLAWSSVILVCVWPAILTLIWRNIKSLSLISRRGVAPVQIA